MPISLVSDGDKNVSVGVRLEHSAGDKSRNFLF
jgi:hypothetical protein